MTDQQQIMAMSGFQLHIQFKHYPVHHKEFTTNRQTKNGLFPRGRDAKENGSVFHMFCWLFCLLSSEIPAPKSPAVKRGGPAPRILPTPRSPPQPGRLGRAPVACEERAQPMGDGRLCAHVLERIIYMVPPWNTQVFGQRPEVDILAVKMHVKHTFQPVK